MVYDARDTGSLYFPVVCKVSFCFFSVPFLKFILSIISCLQFGIKSINQCYQTSAGSNVHWGSNQQYAKLLIKLRHYCSGTTTDNIFDCIHRTIFPRGKFVSLHCHPVLSAKLRPDSSSSWWPVCSMFGIVVTNDRGHLGSTPLRSQQQERERAHDVKDKSRLAERSLARFEQPLSLSIRGATGYFTHFFFRLVAAFSAQNGSKLC